MAQSHSLMSLNAFFLLFATIAEAQDISFYLATSNACNVANYPCLGVELCCPLPAVCISETSSGSIRFVCVDAAGFPVNGGAPTSLPGGGAVSPTTSVKVSPVVIPTPVVVLSPTGGRSVTPLPPIPSTTSLIPLPSTSISRSGTFTVPVTSSTTPGGGIPGGNSNGAATPVVSSTSIIATSIRPSSSSAVTSNSGGNGSGSGGGSGNGSGGGQGSGGSGNNGSGSGSGSASNGTSTSTGTTGSGNGTASFKGGSAPRGALGYEYWGLFIAAGVIAAVGAIVVE